MLVKCRNCGVSFDSNMGHCLACRTEYVPDRDEQMEIAAEHAYRGMKNGMPVLSIRDYLTGEFGLADQDADGVLSRTQSRLREESRQHGRHLVMSGFALLGIALVVFIFTGGFIMATGCLALGGAMVSIGTIKTWTGWNITGHDDD